MPPHGAVPARGRKLHCAKSRALIHQPRQLMLNIAAEPVVFSVGITFPSRPLPTCPLPRWFRQAVGSTAPAAGSRGFAVGARYAYET